MSDRLAGVVEQRSTFSQKDVKEIWDRYLSNRKIARIRLCRVLLSCRGKSRDSFLLRNGQSKIDKALDVRSIVKTV